MKNRIVALMLVAMLVLQPMGIFAADEPEVLEATLVLAQHVTGNSGKEENNHATNNAMCCRSANATSDGMMGLMKFDISGIVTELAADYEVVKAEVEVTALGTGSKHSAINNPTEAADVALYYLEDDTWESTITYATWEVTKPFSTNATPITDTQSLPDGQKNYKMTFDITDTVRKEVAKTGDTNLSLVLRAQSAGNNWFGNSRTGDSDGVSRKPALKITLKKAFSKTTLLNGTNTKLAEINVAAGAAADTPVSASCKDALVAMLTDGQNAFAGQIKADSQDNAEERLLLKGGTADVTLAVTYSDGTEGATLTANEITASNSGTDGSMSVGGDSYGYFKMDISSLAAKKDVIDTAVLSVVPQSASTGAFVLGVYPMAASAYAAAGTNLIETTLLNEGTEDKNVLLVAAVYINECDEYQFQRLDTFGAVAKAGARKYIYFPVELPEDGNDYQIKLFVLESLGSLKPYSTSTVWN